MGVAGADPPAQQPPLNPADNGRNHNTQKRQDHHTGKQAFQIIERTGLKDIGTNAIFRAQHFGGDQQDDRNRQRNTQPRQDAGHGAGQDNLAHDALPAEAKALPHPDQ